MFVKKIGIDLGTANILVFIPQKGVVANEPSVVAVSLDDNKILAVGNEAKEMLGKTPDNISASRPVKDGVIADYKITEAMVRYFMDKVSGKVRFFKPEVIVSVPAGITSTERRAVIDATLQAGAKAAFVVKEPILAAIGAGIPINTPFGNMIVDIGGGTSEVAIISLGGVVSFSSVRVGGDKLDQAIADYIRRRHGIAIGSKNAEEIKIKIGNATIVENNKSMEVRGRNLISGLPKTIKISSNEIVEAMQDELQEIIKAVKDVLRETPPELSSDVIDRGMVLSGGGALLRNLDKLIAQSTGVPCYTADDPLLCVIKGTGIILDNLDLYRRSIISRK
ncbi:MAG: rod shape-determining protein [Patescibacteria group bacterium]|nr:rod shape-determining protein [Patescibacteria group bacterium]